MRNRKAIPYLLSIGSILIFAGLLLAQNVPDRALIVNGKSEGTVMQMGGHAYVDVETVARFTNGSVTLEQNRVVLAFPVAVTSAAPSAASAPPAPPPPGPQPGLSRSFAGQAIAELAEMREWRGAVGTILTYGVPVAGTWPQDYHDRVGTDLDQVAVSVATPADADALQLLRNEYANLSAWADSVVATRKSLNATNTVRPDTVQNDQALAKISACGRFLSSMLVSGAFADDTSCH